MQINSSTPMMTGSIEDMIAQLGVELEEQAADQRKASRQAENARHHAAIQSIEKQRDVATTQLAAGLVGAGAAALSAGASGSQADAIQASGKLAGEALNFHKADQTADAATLGEKASVMENMRGQHDDGAQANRRFADRAMTHLSDIQSLMHEARMTSIRG